MPRHSASDPGLPARAGIQSAPQPEPITPSRRREPGKPRQRSFAPMIPSGLWYGDNLDVLRRHIGDETVDLIYLDPPFNSNRTYNVLFKERSGDDSPAQIQAFVDTWRWDQVARRAYDDLTMNQTNSANIRETIAALRQVLGPTDMMAYLVMMTARLVELHRVLKPTGSLYLHCDPTASHYLKLLLDTIFGVRNFRNEIIWKRRTGSNSSVHGGHRFGAITDTILFYAKSEEAVYHPQYSMDADGYQSYIDKFFHHVDPDGRRYQTDNLANPAPRPNLMYDYKGYPHPPNGWAISREKMELWDTQNRLHFPKEKTGRIRRKRYLDELKGKPIQNLWDDIDFVQSQASERLGYPTQKPLALLERITAASSNPGDLVLDPFCGCGTAVVAAEKLGRRWLGIDVTHLAISVMKYRLETAFPGIEVPVHGEPTDLGGARRLAKDDPYEFQWWANSLVTAVPKKGKKKGGDGGVDGIRYFVEDHTGKLKRCFVQVKGGKLKMDDIRALHGAIVGQAELGLLISMEKPTSGMLQFAADAGFYRSPAWGSSHVCRSQLSRSCLMAGIPSCHQSVDCSARQIES